MVWLACAAPVKKRRKRRKGGERAGYGEAHRAGCPQLLRGRARGRRSPRRPRRLPGQLQAAD